MKGEAVREEGRRASGMEFTLTDVLVIRLLWLKINSNSFFFPFVTLHLGVSDAIILMSSPILSFFYEHAIMISHASMYFFGHVTQMTI